MPSNLKPVTLQIRAAFAPEAADLDLKPDRGSGNGSAAGKSLTTGAVRLAGAPRVPDVVTRTTRDRVPAGVSDRLLISRLG
jgi:hypothetical protein